MKMIQLANGAFVRSDTITSIVPLPLETVAGNIPPRVVIRHWKCVEVVEVASFEDAKEMAAAIAEKVKDKFLVR